MATLKQSVSGDGLAVLTSANAFVAVVVGFYFPDDAQLPEVITMTQRYTPAQWLAGGFKFGLASAYIPPSGIRPGELVPANALCVTDANANYLGMVTAIEVPPNGGPPTVHTAEGEIPPAVWAAEGYRLLYFPDL